MPTNQPQTQQPYTFSQEVYGFARFISSTVLLTIYLGFAFIPNAYLESWGIIFYPAKYWFCALPALIIFIILLLMFNYIAFNLKNTHSPYTTDAFLRDNLSRRIKTEDVLDTKELYRHSIKQDKNVITINDENQTTKRNEKSKTATTRPTTRSQTILSNNNDELPSRRTQSNSRTRGSSKVKKNNDSDNDDNHDDDDYLSKNTRSKSNDKMMSKKNDIPREATSPHGEKIAQIYRDIDIDPSKINPVDHRPILDPYDLAPTLLTNNLIHSYVKSQQEQ